MAINISLSGEAEQQAKEITEYQGGTISQNVRQAIKQMHARLFPNGYKLQQQQDKPA